jgi:NHL repeat
MRRIRLVTTLLFFACLIAKCKKQNVQNKPLNTSPSIQSITPTMGPYGTIDTIIGINLTIADTVQFNGKLAVAEGASGDTLFVIVPLAAGSGPITVTGGGTTIIGPSFNYIVSAVVTTVAGDGKAGFVNGQDTLAEFNGPTGIAIDARRNLYVGDNGNFAIRKISPSGIVSTFVGTGGSGFQDGPQATAKIGGPEGIAFDLNWNLYVADDANLIQEIMPDGYTTALAGRGGTGLVNEGYLDGLTFNAEFDNPASVAIGQDGTVYVADSRNARIRKIYAGVVSTVAGNGINGLLDGPAASAEFYYPTGIAIDKEGTLFVTDLYNYCVREIKSGNVKTLAGTKKMGFVNGAGNVAEFNYLHGIAVDSAGNVYVADGYNACIRKITADGIVSTLVGSGKSGHLDGPGNIAQFVDPDCIAIDQDGSIYVTDPGDNRVRKITFE